MRELCLIIFSKEVKLETNKSVYNTSSFEAKENLLVRLISCFQIDTHLCFLKFALHMNSLAPSPF